MDYFKTYEDFKDKVLAFAEDVIKESLRVQYIILFRMWEMLEEAFDGFSGWDNPVLKPIENSDGITWEECAIRKWLNGAFLSVAFNANEQKKLHIATVSNDPYSTRFSEYGTQSTKDRVFLPSISELTNAEQGFSPYTLTQDAGRTARYTDYARLLSFSAYEKDYVLRTPGDLEYEYTMVAENGGIHLSYADDGYGIRPVVCVDLKQF